MKLKKVKLNICNGSYSKTSLNSYSFPYCSLVLNHEISKWNQPTQSSFHTVFGNTHPILHAVMKRNSSVFYSSTCSKRNTCRTTKRRLHRHSVENRDLKAIGINWDTYWIHTFHVVYYRGKNLRNKSWRNHYFYILRCWENLAWSRRN